MRSTERDEFSKLLAALCAGHNQPMTPERFDGYWRGLANMALPAFERVVDYALGEKGPEKLPTAPQVWRLHRQITASARVQAQPAVQGALLTPHLFDTHANRVLWCFLYDHHGATPESLAVMLAEKRRLCDAYRVICEDEPAACSELRDKLIEAFERTFVSGITPRNAPPSGASWVVIADADATAAAP